MFRSLFSLPDSALFTVCGALLRGHRIMAGRQIMRRRHRLKWLTRSCMLIALTHISSI